MRKSFILVFMLLIGIVLFAACSGSDDASGNNDNTGNTDSSDSNDGNDGVSINTEGFPIVEDKITLTIMAPNAGSRWEDLTVLQQYQEMTNIELKYETPPMSDFGTRLNLAFASGEIADILYAPGPDLTSGQEVEYGEQGLLMPLNDLIENYAPNIKKYFEEHPEIAQSVTTLDGNIYALPRIDPNSIWYRGPMWYNGRWLEALNADVPKTTDELYELLVRFKTEDPNGNGEADEIPLSDVGMANSRQWLMTAFGHYNWGIEEIDGVVRYSPIEEGYKEYLIYMHKLYSEGLLDPETFSQSNDQKKAKGQDNRLGLFPDYFSFFTTGETEQEAINNPMFHPLTSHMTDTPIQPLSPGIQRGAFAITKNNPHPEASIRWVDHFYSKEGNEFLMIGKAGDLWDWTDEAAGERDYNEFPDMSPEEYRGTISPAFGINAPHVNYRHEGFPETDFEKFIQRENEEKYLPYAKVPFPLVYLTSEEQREISTIAADLTTYVEQMEAKFITGVEPLSNWDKYIETIEKMNIERYVEIYQGAYDRWASAE